MFNSKRRISSIILCVFLIQIFTSTVFDYIGLSTVGAASPDGRYELSSQSAYAFEDESNKSTLIGDVDGNGQINSVDYAFMKRVLLGTMTDFPVSNGTLVADVSGDGVFNSTDYAYMKRYILGTISEFPAKTSDATPTPSVSITPVPPEDDPPSKPTGLMYSSVSSTAVKIYWEPSIDGDVIDYAIFKNGEFENLTDGTTTYTVTHLVPNETYEFKVCAINAANNKSEFSDICFVTTKISNMEDLKKALMNNFAQKGTTYSFTYEGDIKDIETKVSQAISDAVNESNAPFMLKDTSYSMSGSTGRLQITFSFAYDTNQYIMVARSTDEMKKVLSSCFYDRTQNINIIYKGSITSNDIDSAIKSILNNDTYLKTCIGNYSYEISSIMETKAIRYSFNYKTTKEQEDYIDSTVEFIVSRLTNNDMSDDEKEKLIHDYILTNVDYADEKEYANAYSALYYGKARVDGYAMLTYRMLKAAGIENIITTNDGYAWNIAKINGKWFHLDTAWNDAKKKDYGFYKYYNLTDNEIMEKRAYTNVYGIECVTNYIADLTGRNAENDGKYGEILKDIKQNEYHSFINRFTSTASLNLLYNEVVLKEGESILLVDDKIPAELYADSFQWSTSDPDIVTVSDGIITAEKAGTVIISAKLMYDMFFPSSLFCKVQVVSVDPEDEKTPQTLSQQNITGFKDSNVRLQLTINGKNDVNTTTTVTNATGLLEGKTLFIGEPINITSTSDFNWAQIAFKLSDEQLETLDINDLVIYWYDEETGTIIPQATIIDEVEGVISATVTHFSTYFVAPKQISDLTTIIAFVIDSKHSSQNSLDTFKTSIYNTIAELRKESNVRAIFIDAKTNEKIHSFYVPSAGSYIESSIDILGRINTAFNKLTPGEIIPSGQDILGTVNRGMTSGNEEVDSINTSGEFKSNKYVLFYTQWDAKFSETNTINKKMGDTAGLVVGKTVGYYAGGAISYNQADIRPLVEFLKAGNYNQVTSSNTNKSPWELKQNGNNNKNDVAVLQKTLVQFGYLAIESFGTYDYYTEEAVKKFQANNGLTQDGIVDKLIWKKLMLPWDEQNAQPDRSNWKYNYVLQDNNYYTQEPQVILTRPDYGAEFEAGESVKITATGTNCHHLAVFINGEWKKTVSGDNKTSTINMEYDYVIPEAGTYVIQVKGRNVPGSSGGVLVESETIIIKGELSEYESLFEDVLVITKYENGYYGIYEELWWQDLHKIKELLSMLEVRVDENGDIFLPTMQPNNFYDVRTMMIIQKSLWTTKVTGVWDGNTLNAIENIFTAYGVHKDVFTLHLGY